ncbi:MAG: hypothetical protein IPP17_02685 [Bacteroidetes bacterium]|nr:hypothetical protein [Bacteroidota bacterium]
MDAREIRYGWALMKLDSIGRQLKSQNQRWHKAKNRYWSIYKSSRLRWLAPARQMEKAHGLICQIHRVNAPLLLVEDLGDRFRSTFEEFRKLRYQQMQIPNSEVAVEKQHLMTSMAIYIKTEMELNRQGNLGYEFVTAERRWQASWYRGERALAANLRNTARDGMLRLGAWIKNARAEAKRQLASRR